MVNPGFTDSHYMREAFGSVAYGFMPMRMDPLLAGVARPLGRRAGGDGRPELAVRCFLHVARTMGEAG